MRALHFVKKFLIALMVLSASLACSQEYPVKPIRIVTSSTGGGNDFAARIIAQGLTAPLGQQLIVENRPSGVIPGETVAKAPPDGYTLLLAASILWIGPLLQDTPYDPVRDFAPIAMLVSSTNLLVVHPSLPVKSVKELIALARASPGQLNYGSAGTGAQSHLAPELFKAMADLNIVRIPYAGLAPAINALISGEVHLAIPNAGAVTPHLRSGRLRALAVTSAQPSVLFPTLPTVASFGLAGYEAEQTLAMFAPAKTSGIVIKRLNQEIVRLLNRADVKEKFLNTGSEIVANSPSELAAAIRSDMSRMGKVIKDARIRVE
jgi:tripartite-type tricarboxylate transporter receptor subunit TctC